jgi:hypothetical protein
MLPLWRLFYVWDYEVVHWTMDGEMDREPGKLIGHAPLYAKTRGAGVRLID